MPRKVTVVQAVAASAIIIINGIEIRSCYIDSWVIDGKGSGSSRRQTVVEPVALREMWRTNTGGLDVERDDRNNIEERGGR